MMPIKDRALAKEYHKKYMREVWYPKNRKLQLQRTNANRIRNSELLRRMKEEMNCSDCGYSGKGCPEVLEFDHIEDNKKRDVAHMRGYCIKSIMKEIEKCEVVCANCHRIRTMKRRLLRGGVTATHEFHMLEKSVQIRPPQQVVYQQMPD